MSSNFIWEKAELLKIILSLMYKSIYVKSLVIFGINLLLLFLYRSYVGKSPSFISYSVVISIILFLPFLLLGNMPRKLWEEYQGENKYVFETNQISINNKKLNLATLTKEKILLVNSNAILINESNKFFLLPRKILPQEVDSLVHGIDID